MRSLLVVLYFFVLWCPDYLLSQRDASDVEFSLLTCGSGAEIYSIFGHSAIRLVDKSTGRDWVYNWGIFDFNDPDFYKNFLQGKLRYRLGVQRFSDFLRSYKYQRRTVMEQAILLDDVQKKNLLFLLEENSKPENRYYLYDFFFDNCSTRIRDLLARRLGLQFINDVSRSSGMSFREGLHEYNGSRPWVQFGMDLIVGSRADELMDASEQMYLPQYLMENLSDYVVLRDSVAGSLLGPVVYRLDYTDQKIGDNFPWPLVLFSIFFFVVLAGQLFCKGAFFQKWLDVLIFLVFGIAGLIMAYMWWGTDHYSTKANWNLLWANPLYLLLIYPILRGFDMRWIYLVLFVFCVLLLVFWRFLPQDLHPAVLPLVGVLALRSLYNYHRSKPIGFGVNR